jgi:hypothetical protein
MYTHGDTAVAAGCHTIVFAVAEAVAATAANVGAPDMDLICTRSLWLSFMLLGTSLVEL